MALSKSHYISTGKDGLLHDTSQEDVDQLFQELATKHKIVLHIHGGLVSQASGMALAERLERDCYRPAGAHAVFFVWESGLLEVVKHNLPEIFGEDFFKILLKWVLKFAAAKLGASGDTKAGGLVPPKDLEIYRELAKNEKGIEPFNDWPLPDAAEEITSTEKEAFEQALSNDADFQETVEAIVNALVPETEAEGTKGVIVRSRRSARTLMSPEIVEQLKADAEEARSAGQKGILSTARLVKAGAATLVRVIRRFAQHRDHGLYPTVVEEILREFYVANIGTAVWSAMKKETADSFLPSGKPPPRGGWYFARKLQQLIASAQKRPEITLVGHSTGAVFINNLLAHLTALQKDPQNPLAKDFVIKNVIFLAPACTFEHFVPTITDYRGLFKNFRMFSMTDAAESRDMLVPYVYTRSLLYFISGALEPSVDGGVEFDKPILGMKRYYDDPHKVYRFAEIETVRQFLGGLPQSRVWSPVTTNGGGGLSSTSLKHGDFDNNEQTLASLRHILEN